MGLDILKHIEYTDESGYQVHHISINQEDKISIFQLLDQHILYIHQGKTDRYTAKYVKEKLKDFIVKQTSNNKKGAVAEIFTHLLLKLLHFEQRCCFKNLEENSMKKGFDGVYVQDNEIWFMESKSTESISHHLNINIAIRDITEKITKCTSNDPWANALFHAERLDSEAKLKDKLEALSIGFSEGIYPKFSDFNIIPSSTVYRGSNFCQQEPFDIDEVQKRHGEIGANNHLIVCCTHDLLSLFDEYLEWEED